MKEIPDICESTFPDVLRENGWNVLDRRTSRFLYEGKQRAILYITMEEIKKIELVTLAEREAALAAFGKGLQFYERGVDAALEAAAKVRLGLKP